ncbi:MAG: Gluconolactonase precursor, partial [Verrucomicrobiota bacterium]
MTLPTLPLQRTLLAVVLAIASPGLAKETLFVATPLTSGDFTQGIEGPACDHEGTVYCVSFRDARHIGRVKPDGTADLFVALPEGSWGNGIRFDPAGTMYVADYTGHNVLRIDPKTLQIRVLAHDDR